MSRTTVASSFLLLAGCAHYAPALLVPAETLRTLESRRLDDPRLWSFIEATLGRGAAAEPATWGLGKLTAAALYYGPEIELARSAFEAASAAAITARQRPNPTLSLDTTFSPSTVSPIVDFLVETFGRREYRAARADALVAAARQDIATAAWQVRGAVRAALLELWAAEGRASQQRRRLALQEQLARLLERRLEEGVASALDVTRERINRDQVSLALRDAELQRDTARAELAVAIGVPLRALDGVTFSFSAFDRGPERPSTLATGEWRRQALLERGDVQGLLAEYAAAEAALRLEIAKQFPSIRLGPAYSYEFGADEYELGTSIAVELPVLNRNQGPIAEAEAQRRLAAARFISLQTEIIGAIDAALARYDRAAETVATADRLLANARDRSERVSRSFGAGAADRVTLVGAQLELALAELSRFDALVGQHQALGALEDALRQPLFDPDARVVVPETYGAVGPGATP